MSITLVGTILIVENFLSELETISYYLKDQGYNIIKTNSAKVALEIVLQEKPDAIVTDVVMPGMSGFELCRFLNKNLTNQKVPVVICSTDQAIHHTWARKHGADAYITKPYTPEQLQSIMQLI